MNDYKHELNVMVDLDAEQGRRPNTKNPNIFRLLVRPTKTVNLAVLNAWLSGKTSMSEAVLEALSTFSCPLSCVRQRLTVADFLDHVIREYPSTKFLALRRSFFDADGDNKDLGNGVLAFKGVYQAIRPAIVSLPYFFSHYTELIGVLGTWIDCERRCFELLLLGTDFLHGSCHGGA